MTNLAPASCFWKRE